MDATEARSVLGLGPHSSWTEVRAAYRRLVRANHPDVAADPTQATDRTSRINSAYAVLRETSAQSDQECCEPPKRPPHQSEGIFDVTVVDADSLALGAPAEEAFFRLLEVAEVLGDVTFVDPGCGLLETLVTFDDGRVGSLVLSLQGRANETTETFCTLQPLDAGPAPPITEVVALLAELLRGQSAY